VASTVDRNYLGADYISLALVTWLAWLVHRKADGRVLREADEMPAAEVAKEHKVSG
jgi:hypothetical protein